MHLASVVIVTQCQHCKRASAYNVNYDVLREPGSVELIVPLSKEPSSSFPKSVKTLSSSFVDAYSQASTAEKIGLIQIAGMGYRKSLEYLVTDFLLANNLVSENDAQSLMLSKLIKKIPEEDIRDLALASAWIGNDETHYYRQNPEYGIKDIKEWIQAMVSYIEMKASVNRAHDLVKKPKPS